MKKPIIAIGLDAADPVLLENWMAQGYLKNLSRLRSQGTYCRLDNIEYYKAETPWTTFLTGCLPQKTGYWTPIGFDEGTYNARLVEAYDFKEYSPFYALGDDHRVAVFDMPQAPLSEDVNGIQVLAWGAHSPQTRSHSKPENVLPDILRKYGEHPALHNDHGDWWDEAYLTRLKKSLDVGIERRVSICRDLLQQDNWDLFLTIFGETHSAGHDYWFLSQADHPLYHHHRVKGFTTDPMLEVFEAVDRAVGEILESAPESANLVVFAAHGSGSNTTDVSSMLLLPELLYRYSFPGKAKLPVGNPKTAPLPVINLPETLNWQTEIWRKWHDKNPIKRWFRRWVPEKFNQKLDRGFAKLYKLAGKTYSNLTGFARPRGAVSWQPTIWYQPYWHQMKAFAIPSFSEGYIRINLEGREPSGTVSASDYDAVCDEITAHLHELRNPRTGAPVVKKVVRTRKSAGDRDPKLPDADLVVVWDDTPADVIDSPKFGRIGPIPYRRTGSHRSRGFMIACGPEIEPGLTLDNAHAVDLAPTILDLMEVPIPDYFDGKPILKKTAVLS